MKSVLTVRVQKVKIFVFSTIPEIRLCSHSEERIVSVLRTWSPPHLVLGRHPDQQTLGELSPGRQRTKQTRASKRGIGTSFFFL